MDIQEQLKELDALKDAYELECKNNFENSDEAIRRFHHWHTAAVEFFANVLGVEDPLFLKFQPDGLDRNGYVLHNVYHSILGTYAMLIAKAKTANKNDLNDIWQIMHPEIIHISKSRFESGFYADAVVSAFKEINVRVRELYKQKSGQDKDGASLMLSAFSVNNSVLEFKSSSEFSDNDIQEGYMHMFAGALKAIRNPKSHENETISKEDALRKLAFASMLMYKLDTVK